jgi:hypothetical protein
MHARDLLNARTWSFHCDFGKNLASLSKQFDASADRGFDLISGALLFGRLWYGEANAISNAIGYAQHRSRSHDTVIRVYDEAGNVIETQGAQRRLQRVVST